MRVKGQKKSGFCIGQPEKGRQKLRKKGGREIPLPSVFRGKKRESCDSISRALKG
ncbi:hypothetical protein LEP1GSC047_4107 [Leptospira inadai serovar Lyme str. 10]|uniref:Uncharacterized protein n=1 Tax=Leptospira inadai serovar Lyme str. 10 TaxID=1049790 RepID=V6HWQ9_9LEPT|nr:hypothetical protein LEP1GSC047_4107 [Leptospira inadai serovar Lyme str. 10]